MNEIPGVELPITSGTEDAVPNVDSTEKDLAEEMTEEIMQKILRTTEITVPEALGAEILSLIEIGVIASYYEGYRDGVSDKRLITESDQHELFDN